MRKSNQKIRKTHNHPSFRKSYSTSCKGIGGHKKKENIGESKTKRLTSLYNLKKKQQYQGGKNWCYTESFMLPAISNLRTTAVCFGNIELLKQVLNNTMSFVIAKKRSSRTQKHFQIQQNGISIITRFPIKN